MKRTALLAIAAFALSAAPALAHTGTHIGSGFAHPFLGWDHLAAMLAVGAWGTVLGGRATWAVPASFVSAMVLGAIAGMTGLVLPFVEGTILLSVAVLAVLVIARVQMPVWAGMAVVSLFALAHGQAHGAEMPVLANAWVYGAGFVSATALLHALGAIATRFALSGRRAAAKA